MSFLDLTPPLTFRVPLLPITLALVGAGGTGSHLLQNLIKIVLHAADAGLPPIKLVVIDGDTVERKNCRGRQLFQPRDIGHNKAEVLAARFNAAYGLKLVAVPKMATADILKEYAPHPDKTIGILVGCVDRPSGRRVMHAALRNQTGWRIWVDAGNGRNGGQIAWGTAADKRQLRGALLMPGLCTEVPGPSLQFPKLLTLGEEAPVVDCGQRIALGEQDLLINVQMAALGAVYLHKLIIDRELDHLCSQVSLDPPMLSTTMLTETTIATVSKVPPGVLRGEPPRTLARETERRSHQRRTNHHVQRHHQGVGT